MEEQNQENLPQAQPVQPLPVLPKKKSRLPLVVILLIVILLIAAVGIYAGMQLKEKQLVEKSSPEVMPTTIVEPSLVPTSVPTVDETANWRTYTNAKYGFEFKYPEKLKLIDKQNQVILNHSIPYENRGDCDMTGGNTIYKTLDDFNVSFELASKVVSLKNADGKYKAGILDGQMAVLGAEGCGDIEYNFPIENNRTLIVKRAQIQGLSGISSAWNLEEILKVPGVISKNESTKIFDQILSTFKFIDQRETKFTCPENGWESCMPILTEEGKLACSKEAENWYKANCPDFKGLAQ